MMQFALADAEFDDVSANCSKKIDSDVQRTVKVQSIFEKMLAERKQSIILSLFLRLAGIQPSRKTI